MKLSKGMFEEKQGYVCFWERDSCGGSGFFITHSFREEIRDVYQWIYETYGKKNWRKEHKNGLRIMRVCFVSDGWIR